MYFDIIIYIIEELIIEEMLSNEEISNKIIDFIKRTYTKFYFSNVKGEYIYYNGMDGNGMVQDDAFAIGINYVPNFDENVNFDEQMDHIEDIVSSIINDIQFNEAIEKILK